MEAVVSLLASLGFKKRAGDVFTLELAPGVLGFQEVERLVAECRGEKFHAYLPPTVSSPLGYVMPEKKYAAWMFGPDCPNGEVASEMVDALATHGVAFMRSCVLAAERPGFWLAVERFDSE